MERFVNSQIAAKRKENDRANRKADLKKAVVSAKRFATQFAIPAAVSIVVLALLAALVVFFPQYVPSNKRSGKLEQAKKDISPEKSPAPKASQRPVAQALPVAADMASAEETAGVGNSESESNTIADNSAAARVDVVANVPLPGETQPAAVATPVGSPTAAPAPSPSARVAVPGANPGGGAQDPMEQIRDAVEKQSHRGQVTATVQKFVWGKEGAPLDVARIKLSLPKNDMFWHPENIRVEGQGGFWRIEPNIARVHLDGGGVTIELSPKQTSPNVSRASLLPIIISDSGAPQRWTWIELGEAKPDPRPVDVNDPKGVSMPVGTPSVYGLRDKAVLLIAPSVNNSPTELAPMELLLTDPVGNGSFVLRPTEAGRAYPVAWRCVFVESQKPRALSCRIYCYVGYFGVREGDTNPLRKCLMSTNLSSKKWVGDCTALLKESALWGNLATKGDYSKLLREAFLALESGASVVVSQKANCLSFLGDSIESRATSTTQPEKGSKAPVSLQDTVHYSLESRMQSLKAGLQTTVDFRRAALRRINSDLRVESFPLIRDANAVSAAVADERLTQRIAEVEEKWKDVFEDDNAFREWCWSAVCSNAADESSRQIRLLAALWLTVNDSREDVHRQEQEGRSAIDLLRQMQIDLGISLQIRWFPKDWDGLGDQCAKVTPWMARGRLSLGAVQPSPPPAVAAETDAGASEAGPDGLGAGGTVPGPTGADAP
jgi:hypothetical protein